MKVFLIILAVIVVLFAIILSISAEFTIVFDNGWSTKIRVWFIEKDIQLSKLLSFIIAPEKAAADVIEEHNDSKQENKTKKKTDGKKKSAPKQSESAKAQSSPEATVKVDDTADNEPKAEKQKAEKPNYIKKVLDEDGIVGIMLLITNLLQTAGSAINTLIKGLHIYSLYVKMIIGGGDASDIAQKYGSISGIYYPMKGFILNGMKVDQYDDYIQPDFIAPRSEYEFQFIGSISVGLLVKVLLKAGKVFVVNLIKNK